MCYNTVYCIIHLMSSYCDYLITNTLIVLLYIIYLLYFTFCKLVRKVKLDFCFMIHQMKCSQ